MDKYRYSVFLFLKKSVFKSFRHIYLVVILEIWAEKVSVAFEIDPTNDFTLAFLKGGWSPKRLYGLTAPY